MGYAEKPKGKKIDTWEIRKDGREVKVEVRMINNSGSIMFRADCPELDILNMCNKDVNVLRSEMGQAIVDLVTVKFERVLEVDLGAPPSIYGAANGKGLLDTADEGEIGEGEIFWARFSQEIDIAARPVLKALTTEMRRDKTPVYLRKEDPTSTSQKDYSEPGISRHGGLSLELPDTPENRAALQRILDGVSQMREKLLANLIKLNAVAGGRELKNEE